MARPLGHEKQRGKRQKAKGLQWGERSLRLPGLLEQGGNAALVFLLWFA